MSRTVKATGQRTTTGNGVTSTSFTPTGDTFLEVYATVRVGSSVSFTSITDTGSWGFTWVLTEAQYTVGSTRLRGLIAYAFVPAGSYSAGTLTAVYSTNSTNGVIAVVENSVQPDSVTPIVKVLPSTTSTTTPITGNFLSAVAVGNEVSALGISSASSNDLQPGDSGGFTQVVEHENGGATNLEFIVMQRTGSTSTVVDAKNMGTTQNLLMAIEWKAAPAPASPPDGDPTAFSATTLTATTVGLAWTHGSTNHTNVEVYQAPDVAGSPGTWALIATLGVVEAYTVTGLTPATKNHWGVYEVNNDGASSASNTDDATTLNLPTISRVDPAGTSVSLPVRGLGVDLSFTVTAAAGSGSITNILWASDVDGTIDTGTNQTVVVDIDADLPTDGANILTVTVTNTAGDTASTGWNLNISDPGVSIAPSAEAPLVELPVLYNSSPIFRSLRFRDPVTKDFVAPTFVSGDVTVRIDDQARTNTLNLPARVGSTDDFDLEIDPTETLGAQIKIVIDDQSDPKAWLPEKIDLYTYGDDAAFYTEDLIATDGTGVVQANLKVVNDVPLQGTGVPTTDPWEPA